MFLWRSNKIQLLTYIWELKVLTGNLKDSVIFDIIDHVSRGFERYPESLMKIRHDLDLVYIWDLEDVEGSRLKCVEGRWRERFNDNWLLTFRMLTLKLQLKNKRFQELSPNYVILNIFKQ